MAEKEVEAAECIKRLLDYLNALEHLQAPTERQSAVLLGYGWWVRVLRTAAATDRLHQGGFGHEASPLVRTVVHHAAALVRLAKDPDEVIEAVEYQHRQKAQKFAAGAITRQWDLSGVTELPKKPKGPAPAGLVYLEKFETLCHEMGLSDVYVSYMIESAYLHPTANGADVYLELTSEEELRLRNESSLDATPLRVVATFALLATCAFASLAAGPFGDRLGELVDAASQRLGVDVKSLVPRAPEAGTKASPDESPPSAT